MSKVRYYATNSIIEKRKLKDGTLVYLRYVDICREEDGVGKIIGSGYLDYVAREIINELNDGSMKYTE